MHWGRSLVPMRIHRLAEGVIRQIAAGEVVERPASVAKELVENALDAGAGRVEVEVRGGGIGGLTVRDDGCGMDPEEMRLAVERHTTSKLREEADLQHVRTLGFRGEALAALCAVARVVLTSRPSGRAEGSLLRLEGGNLTEERPAAHAVGTTVAMEELFFNVPARRAFLLTPTAEARHTLAVLRRLALGHPHVGFFVRSEGREVLVAPPAADRRTRAAQVYGRALADALVEVELETEGAHLWGLFGPPETVRPTRGDQILFVKGRPVRLGPLTRPLYAAYERYLPRGRHPVCLLYLNLDPAAVDANVHPRKEEGRFRAQAAVGDLVHSAAVRALGELPAPAPEAGGRPRAVWPQRVAAPSFAGATPMLRFPHHESGDRPWRFLGQTSRGYAILETEDGLEFLDPHAAHERVLFERYAGSEVPTQSLLIPVEIDVSFDRAAALERALPRLARLGIVLEPFGRASFRLTGWPAPLSDRQAKLGYQGPVLALADELLDGEPPNEELWRRVACAAALKAGERLTDRELLALIDAWKACREPARCPHGRPVVVPLNWSELERRLGR